MPSSIFSPILFCLGIRPKQASQDIPQAYEPKYTDSETTLNDDIDAAADDFILTILTADSSIPELRKRLKSTIHVASWSESLATAILSRLEDALKNGAKMGETITTALENALREAAEFAKDHPAFMTLIALGILVEIAPYVLTWLGFAEIGIVEDSFAALWQARYAGYVPKGSLFSYLQRLGMTLKWEI